MKQVTHVERRGKWARPSGPRECAACHALSDRRVAMPEGWKDHLVDGQHLFTCSALCRLQRGLK